MTFSMMGGMGGDFVTKVIKPKHRLNVARAKALGEDVWRVHANHQRWLDRFSIACARYNALAISSAQPRDGRFDYPPTPERDDDLKGIDGSPPTDDDSSSESDGGGEEDGSLFGAEDGWERASAAAA